MDKSPIDKGLIDRGKAFRALHEAKGAFVIPNPWDIGTAKLLAAGDHGGAEQGVLEQGQQPR